MKKGLVAFLLLFVFVLEARDIDFNLRIDHRAIQTTNNSRFSSLEEALNALVDNVNWSEIQLEEYEFLKLDCLLEITEQLPGNKYNANLEIMASRPVFNSSYSTNLILHRDDKLEFKYIENDNLYFNENAFVSNLVSVFAFYINLTLGLEAESFLKGEGANYFNKAMKIATYSQAAQAEGWKPDVNKKFNRYRIISDILSNRYQSFLAAVYQYHRKGLDYMYKNPESSRANILKALKPFEKLGTENTGLFHIFFNTKIDELFNIFNEASSEEKKELRTIVKKSSPTHVVKLEDLDED